MRAIPLGRMVTGKRRLQWWATVIAISVLAAAAALGLATTRLGRDIEARTWDWRARLWTPDFPKSDARLVLVDEKTVRQLNQTQHVLWPFPRDVWCPVVRELQQAGVKAIVFDMLFAETTEFDTALAECLQGAPVVTAWQCDAQAAELQTDPPPSWAVDDPSLTALPQRPCPPVPPVPEVAAAVRLGGRVEAAFDADGVIRRALPLVRNHSDTKAFPSLGLAAAMLATGATPTVHDGALHLNGQAITLNDQALALLAWRRPDDPPPMMSMYKLYTKRAEREASTTPLADDVFGLKDKVVFVAGSAAGTFEGRSTPVGDYVPGVFAQIALYEALRGGPTAQELAPGWAWAATVLLALLVALAALGVERAWLQLTLGATAALLYVALAAWLFRHHGLWLALTAPLLAGLLAFAAGSFTQYRWMGRERRRIRHAFAHYLAPAVIEELVRNPDALRLGGERRDITAFFSDIQGFTHLTEQTEPTQLVALLNECLGALTQVILDEGGTIDKYVGDAIVAMFGAPLDQPDHAVRACRAALRCQVRLQTLREDWQKRGLPPLQVRIGLASGQALVGNMGSLQRFDYTMIGDTVNLAARLEGTGGVYGVNLLISHDLAERVRDQFILREVDAVRVKGKQTAVRIFTIIAEASDKTAEIDRLRMQSDAALAAYRAQRWDEAAALLGPLAATGDGPAATLLARIPALRQANLPSDWDGVFEMTKK